MTTALYFVILPMVLATIAAQWHNDVIQSEFTCENLVYAYPSCLHSASCISDYFLECKCVPRILKEMFDVSGSAMDGHTLCLYATFTLEVGEPRCCEYYKRDIFLKRPDYLLTLSGISIPKVDTRSSSESRSSESRSSAEKISAGDTAIETLLPETSFAKLLEYGRTLFGDGNNNTGEKDKNNVIRILGNNRALTKTKSLTKRSKLFEALKCFPIDKPDTDRGYEQINLETKRQ